MIGLHDELAQREAVEPAVDSAEANTPVH